VRLAGGASHLVAHETLLRLGAYVQRKDDDVTTWSSSDLTVRANPIQNNGYPESKGVTLAAILPS